MGGSSGPLPSFGGRLEGKGGGREVGGWAGTLTGSSGFTGASSLRAWVGGGLETSSACLGGSSGALLSFGGRLEGKGGGREVGGWAGTLTGSLGFTGASSLRA